jgi:hypothetical protein
VPSKVEEGLAAARNRVSNITPYARSYSTQDPAKRKPYDAAETLPAVAIQARQEAPFVVSILFLQKQVSPGR